MAPKKPAKSISTKSTMRTRASPRKPSPSAKKIAGATSRITKSSPAKKIANVSHNPIFSVAGGHTFKDGHKDEVSYNSRQTLDEIINEIGKRSLTNVDKDLIQAIQDLERGKSRGYEDLEDSLAKREVQDYIKGKPFNCHSKLFKRFKARIDGLCLPTTIPNASRAVKGPGRPRVVQSIEVPAGSSPKKNFTAPRQSTSRSPVKSASPAKAAAPRGKSKSPVKATAASRSAASKSPRKNATRSKSMSSVKPRAGSVRAASTSPSKTTARDGRAASKSPSKVVTRGKSMIPIKTSAAARRSASRSPVKSTTRGKSTSPSKLTTMTRPLRASRSVSPKKPSSPAKRVTKAVSEARFKANDDYGGIMRMVENEAYVTLKYGRPDPGSLDASVDRTLKDELENEDEIYAVEKGYYRARAEDSLRELGNQDEQEVDSHIPDEPIDQIDETGVVMNQRTVGRPRKTPITHPAATSSPSKCSPVKITRPTPSPSPTKQRSPSKISPTKASSAGGPVTSLRRSPSKVPAAKKVNDMTPLPLDEPSKEGHGICRSATNPEFLHLQGGKHIRKNHFFETMPMKEVWYRNMPPYFSFGETPAMEKYVSDQIEDDLARSHDKKGREEPAQKAWYTPIATLLSGGSKVKTPTPSSPAKPSACMGEDRIGTMWNLPVLSSEEVEDAKLTVARSLPSAPPVLGSR